MTGANPKIYRSLSVLMAVPLASTIFIVPIGAPIFGQDFNSIATSQSSTSSMNNVSMTAPNNNTGSNLTMLNLSSKPLLILHYKITNMTNVNENTTKVVIKGNTTFMLPTGNLSASSFGNIRVYFMHGFTRAPGQIFEKTTSSRENATIYFTGYTVENATVGIGIAVIQTNSRGQLAALNNTIGVLKDEFIPQTQEAIITFWKWK